MTVAQHKNKEWLYNAYSVSHDSLITIAKKCDVSAPTILRYLRRFNIPSRPSGQQARVRGVVGDCYGKWTLVELLRIKNPEQWLATCSCGVTKPVEIRRLILGQSKSCGHCFKPVYKKACPGDKFGNWTLSEPLGRCMWRARCACGEMSNVSLKAVRSGQNRSCRKCSGLRRRGMKYTIVKQPSVSKKCTVCNVDFMCRVGSQYHFCGVPCRRKFYAASLSEPSKRILYLARGAIRRAKKLSLPFDVEIVELLSTTAPSTCGCCGVCLDYTTGNGQKNRPLTCPSIDRVIPELGYVVNNVAVICFRCNAVKNNASRDELKEIVEYIDSHHARHGIARTNATIS